MIRAVKELTVSDLFLHMAATLVWQIYRADPVEQLQWPGWSYRQGKYTVPCGDI